MTTIPCVRDQAHRFDSESGWCASCGKVRADGRRVWHRRSEIRDDVGFPDITEPRHHREGE